MTNCVFSRPADVYLNRREIWLIEGNAKGRHLKKLTSKGIYGRFLSEFIDWT